jgi:hypothetical protein
MVVEILKIDLRDLDLLLLLHVVLLFFLVLLIKLSDLLLQVVLLIVEFILKGKEMLVKRDTVPKESLITASFVLLINLAVLQKLDLRLHQHNLSLHVQNVFLFESFGSLVLSLLMSSLLMHVVIALQV